MTVWVRTLKRLREYPSAVAGLGIILGLVLMALVAVIVTAGPDSLTEYVAELSRRTSFWLTVIVNVVSTSRYSCATEDLTRMAWELLAAWFKTAAVRSSFPTTLNDPLSVLPGPLTRV